MPDAKCPPAVLEAVEKYALAIREHEKAAMIRAIGGPGPNGGHTSAMRKAREVEGQARHALEQAIAEHTGTGRPRAPEVVSIHAPAHSPVPASGATPAPPSTPPG